MTIKIEGMMCEHCVRAVKNALEALGVEAEVTLATGTAVVTGTVDEAQVRAAIEEEGYEVVSIA